MFSSGIRASSMNSSLNSASPVIWTQRADLDAVLLHVHQEVGEPAVLGRVRVRAREQHAPLGLVRERRPHLLAGDDALVAVERPRASSATRGRSPTRGSEKPWHQISSADRIGARKRSFCSSVPWAITVGPPIVEPEHVGHLRRAGARDLLEEDRLLDLASRRRRRTRSASVSPAQPRSLSLRCQSRRNSNAGVVALRLAPGMVRPRSSARSVVAELLLGSATASGPCAERDAVRRAAPAGDADCTRRAARRSPRRRGSAPGRRPRRP